MAANVVKKKPDMMSKESMAALKKQLPPEHYQKFADAVDRVQKVAAVQKARAIKVGK
jgi:hypothetical protein